MNERTKARIRAVAVAGERERVHHVLQVQVAHCIVGWERCQQRLQPLSVSLSLCLYSSSFPCFIRTVPYLVPPVVTILYCTVPLQSQMQERSCCSLDSNVLVVAACCCCCYYVVRSTSRPKNTTSTTTNNGRGLAVVSEKREVEACRRARNGHCLNPLRSKEMEDMG